MLAPYRRILARPGARLLFSVTGLVARLPISMVGLGIVLLVEDATGSYGLAGASRRPSWSPTRPSRSCRAGSSTGSARPGCCPRRSPSAASGSSLLMWSVEADWPIAVAYVLAAVGGRRRCPPIGSLRAGPLGARARRARATCRRRSRWRRSLDEAVFMLGPILVTVLATAVHPVAGLGAALVAGVRRHPAPSPPSAPPSRPPHPRPTTGAARPPMPWRDRRCRSPWSCLALGAAVRRRRGHHRRVRRGAGRQGATPACCSRSGRSAACSPGVITGAISWRRGPVVRVRWGALGMAAAMAPLAFVDSMPLMGLVLFVAGFAIAPTLIATMSLAEQVAAVVAADRGHGDHAHRPDRPASPPAPRSAGLVDRRTRRVSRRTSVASRPARSCRAASARHCATAH